MSWDRLIFPLKMEFWALSLLFFVSLSESAKPITVPRMLMAQRAGMLYLKVVTPDILKDSLQVRLNDSHLYFYAEAPETNYEVSLHLFRRVESQQSDWEVRSTDVQFVIQKKWEWRFWPRLIKEKKGEGGLWDYIGVDWRRWKAEEEDNIPASTGEDDDWLDEEYALIKPSKFPLEEWDDSVMDLLNSSSLSGWLENQTVATVLFFDRATRQNMQTHALFASISKMLLGHVSMARVDRGTNSALMKKMHITKFPTTQLFLGSGEVISFDSTGFKRGRDLLDFLFRQTQPAWMDLKNLSHAESFLTNYSRVAVGMFDIRVPRKGVLRKEKQFDYMARSFRARLDLVPMVFAKVNASLWDPEEYATFLQRYKAEAPLTGLVLDKHGEDQMKYAMKWTHKLLTSWVYQYQFNYVEPITKDNFQEFRNRKKPIVYIMFDDNVESHKEFLEDIKENVAKKHYGKVSFVYTRVKGVAEEMIRTLRCDYIGKTYAVLEDFTNEYMYCATPTEETNLTVTRIDKLVQGYLDQNINPDKVRSEAIPLETKNPGPLFKAVADNLLEVVSNPNKDVIIHFYSQADDKWEDSAFELEKFAELLEDVPTLKVYAIEGLKNERPVDFPDLGYFPCTWMFPMYDKFAPRHFNASAGFKSDRLLWWTHYAASYPLTKDLLPPKLRKHQTSPMGYNGPRPRGDMQKLIDREQNLEPNLVKRLYTVEENTVFDIIEYDETEEESLKELSESNATQAAPPDNVKHEEL